MNFEPSSSSSSSTATITNPAQATSPKELPTKLQTFVDFLALDTSVTEESFLVPPTLAQTPQIVAKKVPDKLNESKDGWKIDETISDKITEDDEMSKKRCNTTKIGTFKASSINNHALKDHQ